MASDGGDSGGYVERHRYYDLLPPHVTPESVERERRDLLERIQQTLACLERAKESGDADLQAHHFRAVTTYFDLKHELPADVHAALITALVAVLWVSEVPSPLGDVNLDNRAIKTLTLLLRAWKRRIGSDDDRQRPAIDWRVVRKAVERACLSSPGCFRRASQPWLAQIADNTVKCAEQARALFRPGTVPLVDDLWAELGPSVKDTSRMECFQHLALFSLLVSFPDGDAKSEAAIERLLPEWADTWATISRCGEWDAHWIKVLSRAAKRFPSSRAWDAYLPFVFAKVHDCLALPSDLGAPPKNHTWPSAALALSGSKPSERHIARLLVCLMGNPDEAGAVAPANQYVLDTLHTVKAFFHPSNMSNVAGSVVAVLQGLGKELAYRLGREKAGENAGRALALVSARPVTDELLQIALLGIYSKNRAVSSKCALVIKLVVCIDPAQYTTVVLDEMVRALDPSSMSQSHLAVTAISSMATFLFHLMCGRDKQSTGVFFATYLVPILKLTLPGIDANDERKTLATTMLYFQVLSWLPLVNDSSKASIQATKARGKLSEELFEDMKLTAFADVSDMDPETDQRVWELGSFLEEWTLSLLSRCFQFFTSRASAAEQASTNGSGSGGHRAGKDDDRDDDHISMQVANLLSIVYSQMSPQVYSQALRQTAAFVSGLFFTTPSSGHLVGQLLYSCMQGSPSEAFKHLIPLVVDKLRVTKSSVDVATLTTSEKLWTLYLLDGMVRFNDAADRFLLRYRDELRAVLRHFLTKEEDKEVYEAAARVLQHLLVALLGVYTHDFRSLPREQWQDAVSGESGAFQYLGVSVSWKRLAIAWHEPSAEELAFGLELLQEHLVAPLDELRELQAAKDTTVKAWSSRLSRVLSSIRGAASVLVDGASLESESALLSGAMPLLTRALGGDAELLARFVALKPMLMARVHELVAFWQEHGAHTTHEVPVYTSLLLAINQLLIWRGDHPSKFRMKEKENEIFKDTTTDVASRAFQKARSLAEQHPRMDRILLASRNELIERAVFFLARRNYVAHFELAARLANADEDSALAATRALYYALLGDVERLLKSPYADIRAAASTVLSEQSALYGRWLLSRVPSAVDALLAADEAEPLKEEAVAGAVDLMTERSVMQHLWTKDRSLLQRLLKLFLQSNARVVKRVRGAADQASVAKKLQNLFLIVIARWVYVKRDGASDPFAALLAAAPAASEHWRFHVLFLASLYPFVQPEELPIPLAVWRLALRQLSSTAAVPVRQIALVLFTQLIKVLKTATAAADARLDSWRSDCEALVYTRATVEALVDLMAKDRSSASAGGSAARSAASEWVSGAREVAYFLAGDLGAYPQPAPLSSVALLNQPRAAVATLNLSRVKLVERLAQANPRALFAADVLEVLGALAAAKLSPSASEEDRHAALTTLAEWLSGLLRALVKTEAPRAGEWLEQRIADVVRLVEQVLPQLSAADVRQWVEVLYVVGRPGGRSGRVRLARLGGLARLLVGALEQAFARATPEDYARQAKWLHLVEALAIHLLAAGAADARGGETRSLAEEFGARTLAVVHAHALAHQYEAVRRRAGKLLFLVDMYARAGSSALPPAGAPLRTADAGAVLQELVDAAALYAPDGTESYVKSKEPRAATHAKETALHWLDWAVASGEQRDVARVLPALLPVALLSEKHAKPEVAQLARSVMDTLALWLRAFAVPPAESSPSSSTSTSTSTSDASLDASMDALLALLERHAASRAWKTRAAVLRFLSTVAFFHWIYWPAERKQRVHALVRVFLTDAQREVQAMAKFALRGLLHHERPAAVAALGARLAQEAERSRAAFGSLKRRFEALEAARAEPSALEAARKRLKTNEDEMARSVLGMSAAVLAFPHDLPRFVPPMVEALGKFLYVRGASSAVSFLGKEARETLLEFKRTHQDTWAETKARLTPAQRSAIEDVALAPSYFS